MSRAEHSGGAGGSIVGGYIVPTKPHVLLCPDANAGYAKVRAAYDVARRQIAESGAELLLLYSTKWLSVIGHQIQADPTPRWTHVDPEWHELGDIPYEFRVDADFAQAFASAAQARGLHARTVAYHGFPMDTGTVVALKLLNPDNRLAAGVVSCNMYADRAETMVLGKAARDAVLASGKKTIAVAVTALSNRMHTRWVPFADDHIASQKDEEWNQKLLELLGKGRLEDVAQLARQVAKQSHTDQKLKALWWLAALMGQHNAYEGEVLGYAPLFGTGGAVVRLTPSGKVAADQEFDEDDVEIFRGDRNVLSAQGGSAAAAERTTVAPRAESRATPPPQAAPVVASDDDVNAVRTTAAPKPVGAYPHARRVGEFVFLSGIGPRHPQTDAIPGGPVRDAAGKTLDYDVVAQTHACIDNIAAILREAGLSLEHVVDVAVYLIDMQRDFAAFNRAYAERFGQIQPTRTTVEVRALPTPIAVELKVVARAS